MSKRKVRSYESSFKDTIKDLYSSGKSIKELSSEYGIPSSTVRQWVIYDLEKEKTSNATLDNISTKELNAIQKELLALKEENEILKKALTIFAQKKIRK
jgi:transposase